MNVAIFLCQKEEQSNANADETSMKNCYVSDSDSLYSDFVQDSSFVPQINDGYKLKKVEVALANSLAHFTEDYNDCIQVNTYNGVALQRCEYLIFMYPDSSVWTNASYSVAVKSLDQPTTLREGVSLTTTVDIGTYRHFSFDIVNADDIRSILIYVNTLNGNVKVFSSMLKQNPTVEDLGVEDLKSGKDRVSYNGSEIQGNTLYVSVLGVDFSSFVINAIVRRNSDANTTTDEPGNITNNKTDKFDSGSVEISDVELIDGQAQKYMLAKWETRMNFKYTAREAGSLSLKVTELSGRVTTSVEIFSTTDPK